MVNITTALWDEGFKNYLLVDRKQAGGANLQSIKSRFFILADYFSRNQLPFTRDNFSLFLGHLKDTNHSPATLNNYIKLSKQLAKYLKIDDFDDYTYFKEIHQEIEVLSREECMRLAEVKIKYARRREELNKKMRVLIHTLTVVGSRIGETLFLTPRDLIGKPIPMIYFRPETTKNSQGRYCPIPLWLYRELLDLGGFNIKDQPGINEDLKRRAVACKIDRPERVHAHLFRHSSITNKLQSGLSIQSVARYHGHSSTDITYKAYFHQLNEELYDELSLYDPLFRQDQTVSSVLDRLKTLVDKVVDKRKFGVSIEESQDKGQITIFLNK